MARTFKFRGYQEDIGLFDVVYSGTITTVGGSATEVLNIRGVKSDDIAFAQVHTFGTGSRTISTVVAGKNRVTIVFSADPVANHKINVLVMRRRRATPATRRKY